MKKVIGIDPGKTTGFAVCENGRLIDVFDTDFWGAIKHMEANSDAVVVIELPKSKHVWHNGATSKLAVQRTGVNVGSCIREAELLIKWTRLNKRICLIQPPIGKKTAEQFKQITGWKGKTNQHQRDAAMLCFGIK